MLNPDQTPPSRDRPPTTESETKYKGVRKRKWGKWVSEIRLPNSRDRIWLGSYDCPEKAARAFDAALYCLRGRHAKFNFPDNPPEIVGGQSLSTQQIQVEAARFANEYCSVNDTVAPGVGRLNDFASSPSSPASVKDGNIDWSFLEKLDSIEAGGSSTFNLFSDQFGDMIMTNELFEPHDESKLPAISIDDQYDDYEIDSGDSFSHHSNLWNFETH